MTSLSRPSAGLRIIRKALAGWQTWRTRRNLCRAYPELRQINKAIRNAQKRHSSVVDLYQARKDFMSAALRGEVRG